MDKTFGSLAYLWYFHGEQCLKFVEIDTDVKKLWSAVFYTFFWSILSTHYRWPTTSLFIVNICSPACLWTFYTIVLHFLHSLHFCYKLHALNSQWISAALMFLVQRKQIPVQTLQLERFSSAGHIITHFVETITNSSWPVMWWLCDATLHMWAPPLLLLH
jgi:hypothetical protein